MVNKAFTRNTSLSRVEQRNPGVFPKRSLKATLRAKVRVAGATRVRQGAARYCTLQVRLNLGAVVLNLWVATPMWVTYQIFTLLL